MNKEVILKHITCPLTGLIFCDPVIAEDGITYEFMAIKNWLSHDYYSPITKAEIGKNLIRSVSIKKFIESFLKEHPEYQKEQFLFKKPFYLFQEEFIQLVKNKEFDKIKEFTTFMLNYDIGNETLINYICNEFPNDIIIHIINNSIDYDTEDNRGNRPIHIICKYSNSEIIKCIIDKNIDLNCPDEIGNRPITYLIMKHGNDKELLEYILNKKIEVNFENKLGYNLFHIIILNGNVELLKLFIEYGLDINFPSKIGLNSLQYAFKNASNFELIKFMIDQNHNFDVDPDPRTTNEQLIYLNDNLTKKEKQSLVLYYLTKLLNKTAVIENYMDKIKEDNSSNQKNTNNQENIPLFQGNL